MKNPDEDQQVERPYRVLSLDGGGMRGIYTGAFLARLTDQFGKIRGESTLDLGRGCDLITGTSTGGIVGCALAVGRPMSEIVGLYREHGPKIFPHRIAGKGSAICRATRGSRYVRAGDKALREALEVVLGDATMLDVYRGRGISLSIPAVLMSGHRAWVFKKTPCSGRARRQLSVGRYLYGDQRGADLSVARGDRRSKCSGRAPAGLRGRGPLGQ